MENNTIVFDEYIAEASAAAAIEFAASALNSTIHRVIQESGGISKNEVATIEKLYEKIITEAMDEFVPSDDELAKMKEALENAGYKVISSDEAAKQNGAANTDADGDNDGDTDNGAPVTESADLAAAIAAKLEIL